MKKGKGSTRGKTYKVKVGDNAHMIAIGENIHQADSSSRSGQEITKEDIAIIRTLFTDLRQNIKEGAPTDKKDAALERVNEVEAELTSRKPRLSTFEYVKNWFSKNLPNLLGVLTSVFIHPIVGKIVESTGEVAADEFKKLLQSR